MDMSEKMWPSFRTCTSQWLRQPNKFIQYQGDPNSPNVSLLAATAAQVVREKKLLNFNFISERLRF